jgi:hypothetical protein
MKEIILNASKGSAFDKLDYPVTIDSAALINPDDS